MKQDLGSLPERRLRIRLYYPTRYDPTRLTQHSSVSPIGDCLCWSRPTHINSSRLVTRKNVVPRAGSDNINGFLFYLRLAQN